MSKCALPVRNGYSPALGVVRTSLESELSMVRPPLETTVRTA